MGDMRMILVLAIALCSCTTDDASSPKGTIVEDCGAMPLQPGRAVAYDATTGAATMSGTDYAALAAWTDATDAWMSCAANHS